MSSTDQLLANIAENPINLDEIECLKKIKYYDDVSQMIGQTPLVRINRLNPYRDVTLLAKIEGANPSGSVKDRIAKYMIDDAIDRGLLIENKTVIEVTSGNTGIGIAMICAIRGYRCELVMPESMSIERRRIMEAYGATVTLIPAQLGVDGAQDYVDHKLKEFPEKFYSPNQFDNPLDWKAHYETTAQEIIEGTDGTVTHFVAGLGTSGTLMGVGRGLKEKIPDVRIISVEPETDSLIQGLKDLKTQYIPGIFDDIILDQRIFVDGFSTERATRDLATEEGIFIGQSAGAALVGALEVAKKLHEQDVDDAVVVVLFADSGSKYISGELFAPSEQAVGVCSSTVI
ncbi:MAG: PLP-dependent cysteine synthase family protein [Candidatus Thorarchaeota archaeon]|jgi:cysteine synthase B